MTDAILAAMLGFIIAAAWKIHATLDEIQATLDEFHEDVRYQTTLIEQWFQQWRNR